MPFRRKRPRRPARFGRRFRRRRGRRPFQKRRRFRRRRRGGNKKKKFLQFVSNQARLNGSRNYHEEVYGAKVTSEEGQTAYQVWCPIATYDKMKDIVESTLGQDGGSVPLGLDAVTDQKKYYMTKYKCVNHIRNISNHPVFLSCYTLQARKDRSHASGYTAEETALYDLMTGWLDDMGNGSTTTTLKSGDNIISYTPGAKIGNTYAHHLKVKNSRLFMGNWRIKQYKLFKLNPGDDVFWTVRAKNCVFNPNSWLDTAGNAIETKGGLTKCFLMKLTGVMGESNAVGSNCAQMQSDVTLSSIIDCGVIPLNTTGHALAQTVTHDILQADYEAPGEHDMVADEA